MILAQEKLYNYLPATHPTQNIKLNTINKSYNPYKQQNRLSFLKRFFIEPIEGLEPTTC